MYTKQRRRKKSKNKKKNYCNMGDQKYNKKEIARKG